MRIRGLELDPGREAVGVTLVGDAGDDFDKADDDADTGIGHFPGSLSLD